MNRIGIIFAMEEELKELLNIVELENSYEIFDITFYECKLNDKELILAESGVGKVNAARCTQILIDNMDVDCIFNIGVAGSVSPSVKVCDIVIGEKLAQHDFDITAFNHEKGYIPNIGKVYIESDPYLLKIAEETNTDTNIHKGVIASGDIFCTEEWMSNKIRTKFDALCVEMEGASIAQVCFLSHIPFLVIRSISDSPDGSENKITYEEFLTISSKKVAEYLKNIILKL
ncbi:MAG: 5'-methylthioadenosine/adenosylhomocysteine nucleosidase [Bacilli bacterium]|nr:5'-methylthioadenosine/adenosylhomocysteine nucleosidase [Bacilli bacterium]